MSTIADRLEAMEYTPVVDTGETFFTVGFKVVSDFKITEEEQALGEHIKDLKEREAKKRVEDELVSIVTEHFEAQGGRRFPPRHGPIPVKIVVNRHSTEPVLLVSYAHYEKLMEIALNAPSDDYEKFTRMFQNLEEAEP